MAAGLSRAPQQENVSTTLSSGITDVATTVPVSDASKLNYPCYLVIDRVDSAGTLKSTSLWEYVKVTNIVANDLTVTRGQSGSTNQSHSSGAVVEAVMTAATLGEYYAALNPEHETNGTHSASITLATPVINTSITGTAIATGAEVTTGTDNTQIVTPKAIGDAGVNTRLKSKLITVTRDLTALGGDVSYTGTGFTPTAIIFMGGVNGNAAMFTGLVDSAKDKASIGQGYAGAATPEALALHLYVGLGEAQDAIVKTFDTDGFTLTWTKTGSPTGSASCYALCFS